MSDQSKTPESEAPADPSAAAAETASAAESPESGAAAEGAEAGSAAGASAEAGAGAGGEASAVKLDAFDKEGAKSQAEPGAAPEPTTEDRLAAAEAELATVKDQHLRAVAEIQNIRRRAERDRRDAEQFGGLKLARDLLEVFDNLEDALNLASDELKENEPGFFNGVDLTRKAMLDAFAKHKITPMACEIGARFDPHQHQAMYEAPAPGAEPGSVIQVMKQGFMIADRLLRPAMVGVASAAAPAPAGDAETKAEA